METLAPDYSKKEAVQQKVLTAIAGQKRCGAGVSMGIGKTLIGLKDMVRILTSAPSLPTPKPLFLVVGPTTVILKSWVAEAQKFGLDWLLPYIDFSTYRSLHKQGKYHKLYLDECQNLKDSHEAYLKQHQGAILGLTGTEPAYKNSEKGKLVARYCPIVIDYTTDEAVNAGILNDYRILVHSVPLSAEKTYRITTAGGRSWTTSEQENYDYWTNRLDAAALITAHALAGMSPPAGVTEDLAEGDLRILRMQAMMKFPSKGVYMENLARQFPTQKVILFCCNQEQAEAQCEYTYHSKKKASENKQVLAQFSSGEILRLACVAQLSEGVNIPDLRVGIIWHAFGNERKASQRIGRMLRLNPDQTATVHILMYAGTVDEGWVQRALEKFDPNKILFLQHEF